MKTKLWLRGLVLPALLFATLIAQPSTTHAQFPEFTYQGRLATNGVPVAGAYDFEFRNFDDPSAGSQLGGVNSLDDIEIVGGVFTVTLDFGDVDFDGNPRWLEIAVRPGASTNGYTTLSPRQPITATPYAIQAASAGSAEFLSGTISTNNIGAGTIAGFMLADGAVGSNQLAAGAVNSIAIADGSIGVNDLGVAVASNTFWRLDGNTGTTAGTHFLGTTDNQPVEIKVNNLRALRLEDNGDGSDSGTTPDGAPNVIGGSPANSVAAGVVGATIGGGGATNFLGSVRSNRVEADYSTIAGGLENVIQTGSRVATVGGGGGNIIEPNAHESTISGGGGNTVQSTADTATIGGGRLNLVRANADFATIGGGIQNRIDTNSSFSVIGGGETNRIAADSSRAVIAGGQQNDIGTNSDYSVIGGGDRNSIQDEANNSVVGGGWLNQVGKRSEVATIGGGENNTVGENSAYATIAGGYVNSIGYTSYNSTIGGGFLNRIGTNASYNTIGGGIQNTIDSNTQSDFIGGGYLNQMEGGTVGSVIAGGRLNLMIGAATYSVIGGGNLNAVASNAVYATIPGGRENRATNYAFAAGRQAKAIHTGAFVWADSQTADFVSANTNQFNVRASGGVRLETGGAGATLDGQPIRSGTVTDNQLTGNVALLDRSPQTFTGTNIFSSRVGIGTSASDSTLRVQGAGSLGDIWLSPTTSGGNADIFFSENVSGTFGIKIRHNGTNNDLEFVGVNSSVETTEPVMTVGRGNTSGVAVRSDLTVGGNVGIGTTSPTNKLHVAGGVSATTFVTTSDRHAKENFTAVSPAEILAKVASLPITQWNFKEMKDGPHLGPMAQDFFAAFGLGGGDTTITTVDADGVALAAIQGLNQKVERKNAEIAELKHELEKLKQVVDKLANAKD